MSESAVEASRQNPLRYVSDQLRELRDRGVAPKLRILAGERRVAEPCFRRVESRRDLQNRGKVAVRCPGVAVLEKLPRTGLRVEEVGRAHIGRRRGEHEVRELRRTGRRRRRGRYRLGRATSQRHERGASENRKPMRAHGRLPFETAATDAEARRLRS